MENKERLCINQHTKVLIPAEGHNFSADKRLLIPFTNGAKIGFVNKDGMIVVKPSFAMYYGECYSEEDFIRVAIMEPYGYPRSGGKVSTYQRPKYGLINHKGEMVLDTEYLSIIPAIGNKNLFTVNKDYKWGVINTSGEEIVSLGTYDLIDGFDRGYARVKTGKAPSYIKDNDNKWGLIDENGKVVLPIKYKDIWKFYGKPQYSSIVLVKEDNTRTILKDFLMAKSHTEDTSEYGRSCGLSYENDYGNEHYEDFAGTYAQDVAGYNDEDIYDAFDGDPDAYWNID